MSSFFLPQKSRTKTDDIRTKKNQISNSSFFEKNKNKAVENFGKHGNNIKKSVVHLRCSFRPRTGKK